MADLNNTLVRGNLRVTSDTNINGNVQASTFNSYPLSGSVGANTIPIRDSNGYVYFNYINTNVSQENPSSYSGVSLLFTGSDGWIRKSSPSNISVGYATSAGSATDSTKLPLTGGTLTGDLIAPNIKATGQDGLIVNAGGGAKSISLHDYDGDGGLTFTFFNGSITGQLKIPYNVSGTLATVATSGSYNNLSDTPSSLPANGGYADYPTGFLARNTTNDWSGVSGTLVTGWTASGNADILFKHDSGKLHVITDGRFYQGIDIYGSSKRVLDEYDISHTQWGDADTTDGLHVHSGRNNEANKIVRTDGNGYLQCGYINSNSGDENNSSAPARIWGTNGSDSYLRTYNAAYVSVGYATSAGNADTVDSKHASDFLPSNTTYVSTVNGSSGAITGIATTSDLSSYLPLSAGSSKPLTDDLYINQGKKIIFKYTNGDSFISTDLSSHSPGSYLYFSSEYATFEGLVTMPSVDILGGIRSLNSIGDPDYTLKLGWFSWNTINTMVNSNDTWTKSTYGVKFPDTSGYTADRTLATQEWVEGRITVSGNKLVIS